MAVTAYKYAGTAVSADRAGKVAWSSVDNAKIDNDSVASCTAAKQDYGDWLRLTNYGFSSGDFSSGSTINGIEVVIDKYGGLGYATMSINDSALYLRQTSGQVGSNYASAAMWPVASTEVTYGGSTDTWSSGLTAEEIHSSDFGIDLSIFDDGTLGALPGNVDYIKIRIHYTGGFGTGIAKYMTVENANISKINGVDVSTISKLDGIA